MSAKRAWSTDHPGAAIGEVVRRGLTAHPKGLPAFLLYDDEGARLYDLITAQPEYYLTRTEAEILRLHVAEAIDVVLRGQTDPLTVVERGAGTGAKTECILRVVLARQARCRYLPIDISGPTLEHARLRLRESLPLVDVEPLMSSHDDAFTSRWTLPPPRLVLFIGSSVGNLEDREAADLLRHVRLALGSGTWLLLGTDLRKHPEIMLRAYDDAAGITAAFDKNVLTRINRELRANFLLADFRHVARWNAGESRIEMHLESLRRQQVSISALETRLSFDEGETIHTESSIKYDVWRVRRLLEAGGWMVDRTFFDDERCFAVHLARGL